MYFVEDEKFPQDLQRKLSSFGVGSSRGTYDKENLIDSKLEYHDPTPNIHELFTKFDKRFFWGQLGSVEVMWSNRMTSCAGLCRYHGRSGQCSIKLSAPLLSLRPRKNLVETLLHEMIHAYLFVTRNYKDRDDHGPEFHKHMYRINKEAGTNITVYHDFNDEVAYYQKHIWRCNGPCQTRRPYFGFVRRAMNRAPGPTDRWWAEHQQTCGGTYIKISEPEKTDKKKGGKETDKDPKHKVSKTPVKIKDIRDFFPSGSSQKLPVNFRDSMKKVSNIHTFKDLNGSPVPKVSDKKVRTFNETNVLGSNTQKQTEVDRKNVKSSPIDKFFIKSNNSVGATVRNIWANKYPLKTTKGRTPPRDTPTEKVIEVKKRQVECPVCNLPFSESIINEHVNMCLPEEDAIEIIDEALSSKSIPVKGDNKSGQKIKDIIEIEDEDEEEQKNKLKCPVCSVVLQEEALQDHLETCLECLFKQDDFKKDEDDCENVPCPCCMKWVPEKSINHHIDECLTMIALKNGE